MSARRSLVCRVEALEDRINLSPPTVTGVVINDGSQQRSMVIDVVITFSENVTVSGTLVNAFSLYRTLAVGEQPGVTGLVNLIAAKSGNVVTLTFDNMGPGLNPVFAVHNSLPDGRYTLGIDASKVSGVDGLLDGNGDGIGGDNYSLPSTGTNGVFRLFGDINGDGAVAASDFVVFRYVGGSYFGAFDYDGDGAVAASDFIQFRKRFGGDLG
jgi:hypothetical protein